MKDIYINLDLGVISGKDINIPDVATRMDQHLRNLSVKTTSSEYRAIRRAYTEQLQDVPIETVKELAKILLFKYDRRVLGFDLIYYHGTTLY